MFASVRRLTARPVQGARRWPGGAHGGETIRLRALSGGPNSRLLTTPPRPRPDELDLAIFGTCSAFASPSARLTLRKRQYARMEEVAGWFLVAEFRCRSGICRPPVTATGSAEGSGRELSCHQFD